jgi:hypothetical protein
MTFCLVGPVGPLSRAEGLDPRRKIEPGKCGCPKWIPLLMDYSMENHIKNHYKNHPIKW